MIHESHFPGHTDAGTERLFFALLPPQRVALGTAAGAEEMLGAGWHLQRADRLHVTLAITEDFDRCPFGVLDRMLQAGEMVEAAPFVIGLDRLAIGNRSAALRPSRANPGLRTLQRRIADAMMCSDVPLRAGWRFSPHMTLGYRNATPMQQRVAERQWQAEEFVLIRSLVGRTRHLVLGRWPLRGTPILQYELF